ncbi:MAG: hypothetical protein KBF93_19035 [Leptospiraceae bacterium]|nr:hypothetical protein [Leptospiraceae bacterium]
MAYTCPSGTMTPSYDHPVRHAIDFSGVIDLSKVKLPKKLDSFREFLYNPKKARVSFLTARLSYCVTGAKFFKDGQWYQKGEFFSVDQNVHEFNRLFMEANPNLSYYESKNPTKSFQVKTYDFVDKGDERAGAINSLNEMKNVVNDIPGKIGSGISIVIFGGAVLLLYKIFGIPERKKEKS